MTKTKKRYVTIKEVSGYLSLPVKSLYELAATRRIPSIKFGQRVIFDLHDIDKVMESCKRDQEQCGTISNKILGELHGN